jgi:hypothetical protein
MCANVVAFHAGSGQYLAAGGFWTARAEDAIAFECTADAARFLARHACEPGAWEVLAGEGDGETAGEGDAAA